MKREQVIKLAHYIIARDIVILPLFELEQALDQESELIKRSFSILEKLGALKNFRLIPWNPDTNEWLEYSKANNLEHKPTENELAYHVNNFGAYFLAVPIVLRAIINNPKLITDDLLLAENFFTIPVLDEESRIIRFGDKEWNISPKASNQFAMLKELFSHKLGVIVEEGVILDKVDFAKGDRGLGKLSRTLYDTMLAINKSFEEEFGIPKFIERGGGGFRIRSELFE